MLPIKFLKIYFLRNILRSVSE